MMYLGVDYGSKRIGLAIASDDTSAVPYRTIENDPRTVLKEILDAVHSESVDIIVVGSPKSMSALQAYPIAGEVEKFVAELSSQTTVRIDREDERLTSRQADALKHEFGQSGQRDAVAAMLILESYLSRTRGANESAHAE